MSLSDFSRRELLAGGAASALLAGAPLYAASSQSPLAQAARNAGMRFGACFNATPASARRGSYLNPDYAALLERDCALLVPENELKWQAIRPDADHYDFARFDAMLAYAQAHGMAMRGHTLLWHRPKWFPAWLNSHDFGTLPASAAEAMLTSHIATVTGRYQGRIASFDVVNEAVDPDSGALVETSLSTAFGSAAGLLDLAYHSTRVGAPGVQLVYNDYMSWEPGNETHRTGVLKLLEGFEKRGTPVDALGIQSHIEMKTLDPATGLGPHDARAWRAFVDEVVGMGYGLVITEFDVKDNALPGDFAARDAKVADYARAYLEMMFSYTQLNDVLCWGLVDDYSWLQGFAPRADKLPQRCCPYDGGFRPKALREALVGAFAGRAKA